MNTLQKLSVVTTSTALLTIGSVSISPEAFAATFTGGFTITITSVANGGYFGAPVGSTASGSFSFDNASIPTTGSFSQPLSSFTIFSPSFVPSPTIFDPTVAVFNNGNFVGLIVGGVNFTSNGEIVIGGLNINLGTFSGSSRSGGTASGTVAYSPLTPATSIPEPTSTIGLFLLGGWLLKNKISASGRSTPASVASKD
jgi:hypothetical protein